MGFKYYNSKKHIQNIISNPYYKNLIILRNIITLSIDNYFQQMGAPKVDLFLISKSISSPIGKGSDSIPLPIKIGKQNVYLADSAQFGMEPIVLGSFDMVYCYLPSFRGENSDDRHLNQFYHCEIEMKGDYKECMGIAENLVKEIFRKVTNLKEKNKFTFNKTNFELAKTLVNKKFPEITFDKAEKLLKEKGLKDMIKYTNFGRSLTNDGELEIVKIVTNNQVPVWVTQYDRDLVAFYQKPDPRNKDRVLNADLLFPSINNCFGGEVVGLGQRQDKVEDLIFSMKRQQINDIDSYNWYINLRRSSKYKTTSGFGLGIERLIAWLLSLESIADTSIYPVIKNEKISY